MNQLIKPLLIALMSVTLSWSAAAAQLMEKAPVLTLEGAKFIAAEAAKKAKAENWSVIIVVADAHGVVKYLERMDGAQLASLDVALQKAKTAARYKRPTKVFQDRVNSGETTIMALPDMMPFDGGLPILIDGQVVGTVGVSGVKGSQDAQIAKAGIDAFIKALKK